MTDDNVFYADFFKHFGRDFAGERAFVSPRYVFRSEVDLAAFYRFGNRPEIGVRNANHYFGFGFCYERFQRRDKFFGFFSRFVHLPVSCNDRFSHLFAPDGFYL